MAIGPPTTAGQASPTMILHCENEEPHRLAGLDPSPIASPIE